LKQSLRLIIVFLALIWLIYLLSTWFPIQHYGIVPRTTQGLIGIVSAPFLHGSVSHLMGNSMSFALFAVILTKLK